MVTRSPLPVHRLSLTEKIFDIFFPSEQPALIFFWCFLPCAVTSCFSSRNFLPVGDSRIPKKKFHSIPTFVKAAFF